MKNFKGLRLSAWDWKEVQKLDEAIRLRMKWAGIALFVASAIGVASIIVLLSMKQSVFIPLITYSLVFCYAIYGVCQSAGRYIAHACKYVGLKFRQTLRHTGWRVHRSARRLFQIVLKYRRFKDIPAENGEYPKGTIVLQTPIPN